MKQSLILHVRRWTACALAGALVAAALMALLTPVAGPGTGRAAAQGGSVAALTFIVEADSSTLERQEDGSLQLTLSGVDETFFLLNNAGFAQPDRVVSYFPVWQALNTKDPVPGTLTSSGFSFSLDLATPQYKVEDGTLTLTAQLKAFVPFTADFNPKDGLPSEVTNVALFVYASDDFINQLIIKADELGWREGLSGGVLCFAQTDADGCTAEPGCTWVEWSPDAAFCTPAEN